MAKYDLYISAYFSDINTYMFLKDLWRYNKKTTVIFLLFIAGWSYINYKQGAVAAPMFQYGMYSGKFYAKDTQHIFKVYVNDQPLDVTKYSMVDRDMIEISLQDYLRSDTTNRTIFFTMHRILNKAGIGRLMKEENYINQITNKKFADWYMKLLEKITGSVIKKLEVYEQEYGWKDDRLIPIAEPFKIDIDIN